MRIPRTRRNPWNFRLLPTLLLLLSAAPVSAQVVPEGTVYVASSRRRVFYPVGCRSAWGSLSVANLLWFTTAEEVREAGYTPTTNQRCWEYWDAEPATEITPSPVLPLPADAGAGEVSGIDLEPPPAFHDSCAVERIIDGDTLVCQGGERIRLLLIDAPESGQRPLGAAATRELEALAGGRVLGVEYDVQRTDRYGRTLAYLWSEEGQVNAAMVARGMALIATYPPNVKYVDAMLALQRTAREAGVGLWSVDGFACRPADFRAKRCGG